MGSLCKQWGFVAFAAAFAALGVRAALADEVTVKGTVLRGTVTAVSSAGVTLETEYGKGAIAIEWADVEALSTEQDFQVLYGDGQSATAPLTGVRDGTLLVGPDGETAVPVTALVAGNPVGADGLGFRDRMRDYWRYWDGGFDAGFNLQEATTDALGFYLGFSTVRTKKPTRLTLAANYRYATQQPKDEDESTIEDRAFGLVRGDYDLTERLYAFASGDATYDAIQRLSIRGVPKLGLGYVLWEENLDETTRNFLSVEAGGAWVYENYFGACTYDGDDDCPDPSDFFAVALGAAAAYHLPYGALFAARVDYLPAVDDFTNDYLLRSEAGLTIPVVDPLAIKLGLVDEYDSTPAEGTDPNSLYFTSALSLLW
jgi:hypothetical protein